MADLKTKPDLLDALHKAAKKGLTHQEVMAQRVSFVMASLKEGSGVTRAQVNRVLASRDGTAGGEMSN